MDKNKGRVEIWEGGGDGWGGREGWGDKGRKLYLNSNKNQKYLIKKEGTEQKNLSLKFELIPGC